MTMLHIRTHYAATKTPYSAKQSINKTIYTIYNSVKFV